MKKDNKNMETIYSEGVQEEAFIYNENLSGLDDLLAKEYLLGLYHEQKGSAAPVYEHEEIEDLK